MRPKLPDGDHLLPSGATLTMRDGRPVSIELPVPVDDDEDSSVTAALDEAEALTSIWLDDYPRHVLAEEEDNDGKEMGRVIEVTVLGAQPTHKLIVGNKAPELVRLAEEKIAGGINRPYDGMFTVALDRTAHRDGAVWPPFLDGVWRDGWSGKPIGGTVEPLENEVQA